MLQARIKFHPIITLGPIQVWLLDSKEKLEAFHCIQCIFAVL